MNLFAARRRRTRTREVLAAIDIGPSRMRRRDLVVEALVSVTRSPTRTLLTALGTVLGVAAVISIVGLSDTAKGAVGDTFDVLRATRVTFTEPQDETTSPALTLESEGRIRELNGVEDAGLGWRAFNGSAQPVTRTFRPGGTPDAQLPVTAASARNLSTIQATVSQGRLYDAGMESRRVRVGVLGASAARQLGLTDVASRPVLYLKGAPITVIGIIEDSQLSTHVLLSLVLPTTVAEDLGMIGERTVDVRTAPGAAQSIAAQGPLALAPTRADVVRAQAPPDPTQLRNQVDGSLTGLLVALAAIALGIGVVAIANTTLLAVMQRRGEIGLRRAMGAAPRHIAGMILLEAGVIGTLGGIMGTSLGTVVIAAVSASRGWAPVLDPTLTAVAPLLGALAGLLAGCYPAMKATRITPLEALQR